MGRCKGFAPRGLLHRVVADLFNTDVRSILMVFIGIQRPPPQSTHKLEWNYQGKSPFYAVDFGAGTAVRGVPWNCGEEVKVAPCAQGGLDVFISDAAGLRSWAEHDFVAQVVASNQLANLM